MLFISGDLARLQARLVLTRSRMYRCTVGTVTVTDGNGLVTVILPYTVRSRHGQKKIMRGTVETVETKGRGTAAANLSRISSLFLFSSLCVCSTSVDGLSLILLGIFVYFIID